MKIFLDDERFPVDGDDTFIIRSYEGLTTIVRYLISSGEQIDYISFDHDLGEEMTGLDCAKVLVEYDLDYDVLSGEFAFYVHSQNPIGKANIEGYLNNYLTIKKIMRELTATVFQEKKD